MTAKNNRAPLLYYIKLCVSFQIHRWIQTEVAVRKRSIRVKIGDFLSCVTLKFDGWPWKTIGHIFYTTPSFVHHFKFIGEFKLRTLKNNRAPLLCCFKLCASFHSHQWFQIVVTVRKRPILVKIDKFFSRVTLKFDWWPWKTIGHLFYTMLSFTYHFKAIGKFKL